MTKAEISAQALLSLPAVPSSEITLSGILPSGRSLDPILSSSSLSESESESESEIAPSSGWSDWTGSTFFDGVTGFEPDEIKTSY